MKNPPSGYWGTPMAMETPIYQYCSTNVYQSGWWFQPLWQIWESAGMIIPYGFPMVFLWFSYGFLWFSYGF